MDDNGAPPGGNQVTSDSGEHTNSGEHTEDPPENFVTATRKENALAGTGVCNVCKQLATGESIQCYLCSEHFHAINCGDNNQLCSRSFFENIWPSQTRNYPNFKWVCDFCEHGLEQSRPIIMSNRLTCIEENVSLVTEELKKSTTLTNDVQSMKSEMAELKQLLLNSLPRQSATTDKSTLSTPVESGDTDSIALYSSLFPALTTNTDHVQKLNQKVNCPSVIKLKPKDQKTPGPSMDNLESIAITNSIPVTNISSNETGETVIRFPDQTNRDKFANVLKSNNSITTTSDINTPVSKLPTITISGLTRNFVPADYSELFDAIKGQNSTLGPLMTPESFSIIFVKPLAKNESVFQAVVRVSNIVRQAISNLGEKIFYGRSLCMVYDRFFVRRCNKCQGFGHYFNECKHNVVCSFCSGSHNSTDCRHTTDFSKHCCINCKTNSFDHVNHATTSRVCKSYQNAQEKLKQSIPYFQIPKN